MNGGGSNEIMYDDDMEVDVTLSGGGSSNPEAKKDDLVQTKGTIKAYFTYIQSQGNDGANPKKEESGGGKNVK